MNKQNRLFFSLLWGLGMGLVAQGLPAVELNQEPWGSLVDGSPVTRFTLTNATGAKASFMTYGAAVLQVQAPDRNGTLADVVLGFDNAADYQTGNGAYIGLTVGRYASRIFGTELVIEGQTYHLESQRGRDGSPGNVILHGGPEGFSSRMWEAMPVETQDGTGIRFSLVSPDGDQGFPGELQVSVTYHWTDDFRLLIDYEATTDKTTVINMTQHSYFNLGGAGNGDIMDHTLQINADFFTFALPDNAVTGEILSVKNTPFDFTTAKAIRRDIEDPDPQMVANRGYNQNFVLRRAQVPGQLAEAAQLRDPVSGRTMTVLTTEPGLFLYTGNFLNTRQVMKGGINYLNRGGVALETGHYPDSPNQPHFPRTTLQPGEVFRSRTVYAFGVR